MTNGVSGTKLRALGFCGADDSVHPNMLGIIANAYPFVEFGVLFRPDKEGEPRYASKEWVDKLSSVVVAAGGSMKLAAHLCGARVNEVLSGDDAFLSTLSKIGFQRVQINATAVNGVDTSNLAGQVSTVAKMTSDHPELEFILQQNEETKPLWQGLLQLDTFGGGVGLLPGNVSMLVDESKGTGVLASSWPKAPEGYKIGYAGGIGPDNIVSVLEGVIQASQGKDIWIDMESSLRSTKNGQDVFDLDKCYSVIDATCSVLKLHDHPEFLTKKE